jgi:hypothetical protein
MTIEDVWLTDKGEMELMIVKRWNLMCKGEDLRPPHPVVGLEFDEQRRVSSPTFKKNVIGVADSLTVKGVPKPPEEPAPSSTAEAVTVEAKPSLIRIDFSDEDIEDSVSTKPKSKAKAKSRAKSTPKSKPKPKAKSKESIDDTIDGSADASVSVSPTRSPPPAPTIHPSTSIPSIPSPHTPPPTPPLSLPSSP